MYEEFDEPRPAIEIALRWLARDRPSGGGDAIVHGDFRNGNLMIAPDGVRGVLDWELVHRGDPVEELFGWLCVKAWRFGAAGPVGGFGTRTDLLSGYTAAGGTAPSPEALHWWEVYGHAALGHPAAGTRPSGTSPARTPRSSSPPWGAGCANRSTTCCSSSA